MMRGFLCDSEAAKALFEKVGLFKSPELPEKYVVASEATVDGMFFSRIFGAEPASGEGVPDDVKALRKLVCVFLLSDWKGAVGEDSSARAGEPDKEVEELRAKVQDMARKVCATQRQLHMQSEVTELASSVSKRLARLKKEVSERASTREVKLVSEKVKEGERKLQNRILRVEKKAAESEKELGGRISGVEKKAAESEKELQDHISRVEKKATESEKELQNRILRVAKKAAESEKELQDHISRVEKKATESEKELQNRILRVEKKATESEKELQDHISRVEKKATESEQVLRDEIQGERKSLDEAMMMLTDPRSGIIARLTRECGGNVNEKGIVEVTASSCYSGAAQNVAELQENTYFGSKSEPDSWVRYDFKEKRVHPTGYSLASHCSYFPRSWVLEVSNDGSEGSWKVVDRRENNEDLNAPHAAHSFAISAPPRGSFRFVRLRQTGKNHGGNDALLLASLDVFGTLAGRRRLGDLPFYNTNPLNGIIAHLTRECGGNVHEKGVIKVTASSCIDEAKNVADLGTDSYFYSYGEPDSWIRYDFKGWRVAPTSYSIKASHCESLRSWVLEVSNDGTEGSWVVVDSRENNEDLKGEDVTHNFAISAPPSGSFRFVRLRQTGKNHNGANSLQLTSLELFGTLSPR